MLCGRECPVYRLYRSYPHFLHIVIYKKEPFTHEKVLFNLFGKCYYYLSTESGSGRSAFCFRLCKMITRDRKKAGQKDYENIDAEEQIPDKCDFTSE